ncbi:MAG: hypothetical protein J6S54_03925 [Lentisphaeria bacterium]|nr:hypothetical protein [Lentisphaeria bacterium]
MRNLLFLLGLAAVLLAGCAKQEVEYTKKWGFGFKDKVNYAKIKNAQLTLELSPGSRKFSAGAPGELVFILRNRGKSPVRIPEWYKFDPNNLSIQCQVWLPGTRKPDPDMWLDVSTPVKRPVWRYPVTIPPGGSHFVSSRLDFPVNLVVTPGTERRYFIKAKLNLKSLDVAAPVEYITIYPGKRINLPENLRKSNKRGQ